VGRVDLLARLDCGLLSEVMTRCGAGRGREPIGRSTGRVGLTAREWSAATLGKACVARLRYESWLLRCQLCGEVLEYTDGFQPVDENEGKAHINHVSRPQPGNPLERVRGAFPNRPEGLEELVAAIPALAEAFRRGADASAVSPNLIVSGVYS
jgi:hypothetical protein